MFPFACIFPCTLRFSPIVTLLAIPTPPAVTIEPVVFVVEVVASVILTLPATDKSSPSAVFPLS